MIVNNIQPCPKQCLLMPLVRVGERELTAPRVTATTRGVANFMVRSMRRERERGVCGVDVVGGAARCPSSEAEMYGSWYVWDRASVRSREFGSVRSSEVQMYWYIG